MLLTPHLRSASVFYGINILKNDLCSGPAPRWLSDSKAVWEVEPLGGTCRRRCCRCHSFLISRGSSGPMEAAAPRPPPRRGRPARGTLTAHSQPKRVLLVPGVRLESWNLSRWGLFGWRKRGGQSKWPRKAVERGREGLGPAHPVSGTSSATCRVT